MLRYLTIFSLVLLLLPQIQGFEQESHKPSIKNLNLQSEEFLGTEFLTNFTFISTYIPTFGNNSRNKRSFPSEDKEQCHRLAIPVKGRSYTFCLTVEKLIENDIVKKNTKILVHGATETDSRTYTLQELNITIATGYDLNDTVNSLEGFVIKSRFYGRIYIDQSTYYVEPLEKFPSILKKVKQSSEFSPAKQAIMYDANDAVFRAAFADEMSSMRIDTLDINVPSSSDVVEDDDVFVEKASRASKMFKREFRPVTAKGHVCGLLLLADHLFLRDIANGSVNQAVIYMLRAVEMANVVFRNADFNSDNLPDNIGFEVKYMMVLKEDSPQNHLYVTGVDNETVPIDGREYLQRMSSYSVLKRVCLGAAFTSRRFLSRALGLSFTAASEESNVKVNVPMMGGLCERPIQSGHNLNALVVTYVSEEGERIPELTSMLSFVHELGHSFGSPHDNGTTCRDFLMSPTSLTGQLATHYRFSSCSKRDIAKVVQSKGYCLERDHSTFCGNGLVEEGEECDCGLPVDCIQRDPCCIPRGRVGACHVDRSRGHQCHPSQGPCCLANCQYRDLAAVGLDCSQVQHHRCPCADGTVSCSCGLLGTCINDSCHSTECTRLGLLECTCRDSPTSHCQTCCLQHQGGCLSVSEITRQLVMDVNNNISVDMLRLLNADERGTRLGKAVRWETVCDHRKTCGEVGFRVWNRGELCVAFGKVGKCSSGGVCDVRLFLGSVFPDFSERVAMSENASSSDGLLFLRDSWIFNLILIVVFCKGVLSN